MSERFLLLLAMLLALAFVGQNTYGMEGSTELSSGVYTIEADGADVWSNSDSFRYIYTEVSGDAEIVLRAVSLEETNEWAKIGVMFRQSSDANSAYAFLLARAAEGSRYFQYRPSAGASAPPWPEISPVPGWRPWTSHWQSDTLLSWWWLLEKGSMHARWYSPTGQGSHHLLFNCQLSPGHQQRGSESDATSTASSSSVYHLCLHRAIHGSGTGDRNTTSAPAVRYIKSAGDTAQLH